MVIRGAFSERATQKSGGRRGQPKKRGGRRNHRERRDFY